MTNIAIFKYFLIESCDIRRHFLRQKKKSIKISQIKLSEVSGYSPAKISPMEPGKETPSANDVNVF